MTRGMGEASEPAKCWRRKIWTNSGTGFWRASNAASSLIIDGCLKKSRRKDIWVMREVPVV